MTHVPLRTFGVNGMNEKKKKESVFRISPKTAPYYFMAPAVIFLIAFTVYPVFSSLILSFQSTKGGVTEFVGLANYTKLFGDPIFYKSLGNTFQLLLIQVPIMITLAVVIAAMLNSAALRFKGLFRTAYFLPAITALVAASLVFMIILDEHYGLANYFLSLFGVEPISWLSHPFWSKVAIVTVMTWRWVGYNMVIFLAGLQTIPDELYEAAEMDGAGTLKKFFKITLPLLKPVFIFTIVISTIGTLQLFDEVYILTGGGPNNATMTITLYLYETGFKYFNFGYASAMAYVLVLIIAAISWLQIKLIGDEN